MDRDPSKLNLCPIGRTCSMDTQKSNPLHEFTDPSGKGYHYPPPARIRLAHPVVRLTAARYPMQGPFQVVQAPFTAAIPYEHTGQDESYATDESEDGGDVASKTNISAVCSCGNAQCNIQPVCKPSPEINMDGVPPCIYPNDQPMVLLDCEQSFDMLDREEKLYAHYMARAAWYGALIVLFQTSPESPIIFALMLRLLKGQDVTSLLDVAQKECCFTREECKALLVYAAGIFTNMGNYRGFGDMKFIPNVGKDKLAQLITKSVAYCKDKCMMEKLWTLCVQQMYSYTECDKQLGLPGKGVTAYMSTNSFECDLELTKAYSELKQFDLFNTRLFKTGGGQILEIRLASIEEDATAISTTLPKGLPIGLAPYKRKRMLLTRGDFTTILCIVNDQLEKAKEVAGSSYQRKMVEGFMQCFFAGDVSAHKAASEAWVQDVSPCVEAYLGFIETYRDPSGQRGEFQGFSAIVCKEMQATYDALLDRVQEFLKELPWPMDFNKDEFATPNFATMDVLAFAGSGVPAGLNLPNYEEVRQKTGHKNLSLANVIPASFACNVSEPFLNLCDMDLLIRYRVKAFQIQVALHELIGHGSGKLFYKDANGTFNFNEETVRNPINGQRITEYYFPDETYETKFRTLSAPFEECRAECVGLYLSTNPEILKIFGIDDPQEMQNILYVNWLNMVWSGLRSLEMYDIERRTWGQAHSQARYAILRVLMEAGNEFVKICELKNECGERDLRVRLDGRQILTTGLSALSEFMIRLQVYKSTADIYKACTLFAHHTDVMARDSCEDPQRWQRYRCIVLKKRQPSKMFIQCNTCVTASNDVRLRTYLGTPEGMIQSWVERYSEGNIEETLVELYERDMQYFCTK